MSALGHTMASSVSRGGAQGPSKVSAASGANGAGGGGRGQNLNHLLGFTLPPRARPPPAAVTRRARRSANYVPFNKERYVNAQYRFLVKPTGDYTAYFADADIFLHWPDILVVLIPTTSALTGAMTSGNAAAAAALSSSPSTSAAPAPHLETHEGAACPICLSPPTAPRMTKCGHIFCYPCLLRYLSTSDAAEGTATPGGPAGLVTPGSGRAAAGVAVPTRPQAVPQPPKWKRCPICWDAVYARDVKAVQFWDAQAVAHEHDSLATAKETQEQGKLLMRLIERPHLTTLALPQSSTWPLASSSNAHHGEARPLIAQHSAPWHFQPDVMPFAKLMLATPDLLFANLSRDASELEAERQLLTSLSGGDDPSLTFVAMAEAKVMEQMQKVAQELDTPYVQSSIAKARSEMKEHEEAEMGRQSLAQEATSQRQQRRRAAVDVDTSGATEPMLQLDEADAEETQVQAATDSDGAAQPAEGAEAWLASKAQAQGGATVAPVNTAASSSPPNESRPQPRAPARARRNINPPAPSSSSYFFYQAASGQHIYLHPLDIKVLLAEYRGSYAAFPRTLRLRVQGADEGSMNDELRRKCKYLAHLPKGTDVAFVEIDWETMAAEPAEVDAGSVDAQAGAPVHSPIVHRRTLAPFEQALKQRRNRRRDRGRREDRAKTRAEEAADAASRPAGSAIPTRRAAAEDLDFSRAPTLGTSYGSSSAGIGSASSAHGGGVPSPTFAESALWAAERYGDREAPSQDERSEEEQEDFPAALGAAGGSSPPKNGRRATTHAAPPKTVWGTPAAKGQSFASALHASSRARYEDEDEGPDWDWLGLAMEEDLSRGGSGLGGRGLNRQNANTTPNAKWPPRTPSGGSTKSELAASRRGSSQQLASGTTTPRAAAAVGASKDTQLPKEEAKVESGTSTPSKQGRKKAKRVINLTGGGGRGTA